MIESIYLKIKHRMEEKKENKGKEDNIKVEPLAKHKVANAVS